jgi:hypothetical protein
MKARFHYLGRLALAAAISSLVVACAWKLCREPLRAMLEDYLEWRCWEQTLHQENDRSVDLDCCMERQKKRELAEEGICRDLIAGRVTLAQAAKQVMELPDEPRSFWWLFREAEMGATDEERMCRHLIAWACQQLEGEPARAKVLRCRLLAELEAILRRQQDG